jgi:hypothetical protein
MIEPVVVRTRLGSRCGSAGDGAAVGVTREVASPVALVEDGAVQVGTWPSLLPVP